MKTILIAGAGHGGLIAAAKLADAGYDVTVLEKAERERSGTTGRTAFPFPFSRTRSE